MNDRRSSLVAAGCGLLAALLAPSIHDVQAQVPGVSRRSAASGPAAEQSATHPHVRGLDPAARELLQSAVERSETVSGLVALLDQTSVIVGVQMVMFPEPGTGDLSWLGGEGGWRHLRIRIERRASAEDRIAWLGHELWHAVEIADEPGVRDVATLKSFYAREGRTIVDGRYETTTATRITLIVRKEAIDALRKPAARVRSTVFAASQVDTPVGEEKADGQWAAAAVLLALAHAW